MASTGIAPSRSICDRLRPRPPGRRDCCIQVPPDIIKDPDPATYSQQLAYRLGSLPTFNSPDLDTVFVWPVRPIDKLSLTLRNLSTEDSAAQTRVELSWSAWGIGLPRAPIASAFVDLARAGFAGSEGKISIATPTEVKDAGRYGIFAKIFHPFDKDWTNNEGEQTVDGFQTSQGRNRQFVIPVRNPSPSTATISLSVGPSPVVPWVTVVPAVVTLAAGAQTNVMASVAIPGAIPPSPPGTLISATIDILATLGGQFIGGVSLLVLFD